MLKNERQFLHLRRIKIYNKNARNNNVFTHRHYGDFGTRICRHRDGFDAYYRPNVFAKKEICREK